MGKINEIKEQKNVVKSVGDFANSLQQIAAARMAVLRKSILASRSFVDESTEILRELQLEQRKAKEKKLQKVIKGFHLGTDKHAIIVITSNQGLCGVYNTEIFKKVDIVLQHYPKAEYFVLGVKGHEYFRKLKRSHPELEYYPYSIPEDVSINDLRPLIRMFHHYDRISLIYSKFINTVTRDVVFLDLTTPEFSEEELAAEAQKVETSNKKTTPQGEFIFEPSIDELVKNITHKLRYALFRQQILDSRLSLYTAQMIAMQTASDNAKDLLKDLQLEYNKERRKLIDKKIQEVQAGRALWDEQ